MKSLVLLSTILLVFLLTGCMQTRYITQQYIKTNIEKHEEGKFSTIKTYTIFKGTSMGGGTYLELTGYKYNNSKALVIGTDKYYLARQKFKGNQPVLADIMYMELSLAQCKDIITNYKILLDKIKTEKPKKSEEVYHDYTVSNDLFISYRKSSMSKNVNYLDFWIYGEKFRLQTITIIDKLNKFVKY